MAGDDVVHHEAGDLLTLRAGDADLTVHPLGATPLRWVLDVAGHRWDVLDGYQDTQELLGQAGVRNGIMAPFCNRVADGRYTFDGVTHDLLPGAADRTIYHGLVREQPFTVVSIDGTADRSTAHLRCTALASGSAVGYPFEVVVDVRYVLTGRSLAVQITGTNVGRTAAPFTSGWHPYFRLPGADVIDRLHLSVPCRTAIRTDPDLIPLRGEKAYQPLDGASWAPVGGAVVDAAFAHLEPAERVSRTVLTDPATDVHLTVSQSTGLVHVFTGDTLDRDRRRSIAVEPVEMMTDAFNRRECAEGLRLEAGESRSFGFEVAVGHGTPGPA